MDVEANDIDVIRKGERVEKVTGFCLQQVESNRVKFAMISISRIQKKKISSPGFGSWIYYCRSRITRD